MTSEEKPIQLLRSTSKQPVQWDVELQQLVSSMAKEKGNSAPPKSLPSQQPSLKLPTKKSEFQREFKWILTTVYLCRITCTVYTCIVAHYDFLTKTDIEECLNLTKGNGTEVVLQIMHNPVEGEGRPKRISVSRASLRRLRVEWMYQNHTFLWLNDEVNNNIIIKFRKYKIMIYPLLLNADHKCIHVAHGSLYIKNSREYILLTE